MRSTMFGLIAVAAAACAGGDAATTAEDVLTARAVAGEEEQLADQGTAPADGDLLPPMRACDAPGEFAKRFAAADGDGSGALEAPEARGVRRHDGPPPPIFHLLRWVYDADDSGDLDADERDALLTDHTARCEALQARLLADFDADGDGTLSDDELQAARDAAPPRPPGPPPGPRCDSADSGDTDAPLGPPPEDASGDHCGPPPGGGRCGPPPADEPPPPVVDTYDADGDGALDPDEAAAARVAIRALIVAGEPPLPPPPAR